MKTNEFIKRVEELGLCVEKSFDYIAIKANYRIIAIVDMKLMHSFNILGEFKIEWKKECELFDLIIKYAKTPVDEREEEKKFYLEHRYFRFHNGSSKYLGMDFVKGNLDLCSKITYRWVKNQFTEKEVDEIKEKFNTDLGDFEKTEVEE